MPMHYLAPTPEDLQQLKESLGLTGNQMAELAGVAGGQQWRKYTGGQQVRELSLHMLFFMAARLVLKPAELARVTAEMQSIGASVDADEFKFANTKDSK
jgi:transcriptional regulator with XRE-family HTH domain